MNISSFVFKAVHLRNYILQVFLERDSTSDVAFLVQSNHII